MRRDICGWKRTKSIIVGLKQIIMKQKVLTFAAMLLCGLLVASCVESTYKTIKIEGKIMDQYGDPVPDARLELKDLRHNERALELYSDAKGRISYKSDFEYGSLKGKLRDGVNAVYYEKNNPKYAGKFKDDSVRAYSNYKRNNNDWDEWNEGVYKIDIQMKLRPKSADD